MVKRRKPTYLAESKKRDILGQIARGTISVLEASKKHKVATSAIYRWQRRYGFKKKKIKEEPVVEKPKGEKLDVVTVSHTQEPIPVVLDLEDPGSMPELGEFPKLLLAHQRQIFEIRINQLEMENKRLAMLVESLAETIGDFTANAE